MTKAQAGAAAFLTLLSQLSFADVNSCITLADGGIYGGFKNSCDQKIHLSYCAYRPKPESWLVNYDCERQQFGNITAPARDRSTAHTKGAQSIHWYACPSPKSPEAKFSNGRVHGRCR